MGRTAGAARRGSATGGSGSEGKGGANGGADNDGDSGKREFLDALANGLRLLEAFDERLRSVTIQSAAELLGVTRPASRRILLTLARQGYLQQRDRFFSLAPRTIELGYRYFRSLGLAASVRPHLQALSRDMGVAVALGTLSGTDVLFIERVEADRPIKLDLRPGDRLPAYAHSLGRILLAQLPEEQLAAHLPPGVFSRLSAHTVTRRSELLRELKRVREQGWSFVNSELVAGLFGVAIAVPGTVVGGAPNAASSAAPGQRAAVTLGLNVTSIGQPWSLDEVERRIVPALRDCVRRMQPITDSLA